jgi:hypothetical protein
MVSETKTKAKFNIRSWVGVIMIETYAALYIIDVFVAPTNPVPFYEIIALAYACIWVLVFRSAEQE